MKRLRVADNHRHLVWEDGRPFFWLGDTAWEILHRAGVKTLVRTFARAEVLEQAVHVMEAAATSGPLTTAMALIVSDAATEMPALV